MDPADLRDSFYLHIMRTATGKALKAHFAATVIEPLPDRVAELLRELDGFNDGPPTLPHT
jgi:hypothetical protein